MSFEEQKLAPSDEEKKKRKKGTKSAITHGKMTTSLSLWRSKAKKPVLLSLGRAFATTEKRRARSKTCHSVSTPPPSLSHLRLGSPGVVVGSTKAEEQKTRPVTLSLENYRYACQCICTYKRDAPCYGPFRLFNC